MDNIVTKSTKTTKYIYAVTALCLSFNMALINNAQAQKLNDLLRDVTNKHPLIQAEEEKLLSAQAAITEAQSDYFPKISVNGSYGYENTDRTRLLVAAGEFDLNPANANITISQNIFAGFKTQATTNSAKANFELAKTLYEHTKQQILFEAIKNYLAVLKQVKLTELSKRNMATLQKQLNLEDEKVQRGSGIAVDVLQAKSRLQISKERYTSFKGGMQEAIASYKKIFGQAPDVENMELPVIPTQIIPATLEEALSIATANNNLLLASNYTAQSAKQQTLVANSGFMPNIDLIASSNYRDDAGGIQGEEISNSAIIQAKWEIFSGFADKARSKQATHNYQAALANAADTARKVEEEVKIAWSNMNISRERAELLENAVNIAGEVYDARKRLRDIGSDTALNLLDAENELFRAEIDATAAKFDYYISIYRLLLAMGKLHLEEI